MNKKWWPSKMKPWWSFPGTIRTLEMIMPRRNRKLRLKWDLFWKFTNAFSKLKKHNKHSWAMAICFSTINSKISKYEIKILGNWLNIGKPGRKFSRNGGKQLRGFMKIQPMLRCLREKKWRNFICIWEIKKERLNIFVILLLRKFLKK